MPDLEKKINKLLARDGRFCLATIVDSSLPDIPQGLKTVIYPNGKMDGNLTGTIIGESVRLEALKALKDKRKKLVSLLDGIKVFFDVLTSDVMIIICGAGHIAVPLAKFATESGFHVIVIDDRPDFAHPSRFPGCEVIAEDFVPTLKNIPINSSTYVVVITRGHEHDAECLYEILRKKTDAAYIGLIGSRRRVKFVIEMLLHQGIEKKKLKDLFTPIGLPIGAESPEEIATSILAEIICVRKKGPQQARGLRTEIEIES
jgi:xanthine dehydrogenase accessory factor